MKVIRDEEIILSNSFEILDNASNQLKDGISPGISTGSVILITSHKVSATIPEETTTEKCPTANVCSYVPPKILVTDSNTFDPTYPSLVNGKSIEISTNAIHNDCTACAGDKQDCSGGNHLVISNFPTDLPLASTTDLSSAKLKSKPQLNFFCPIEPLSRKRKVEGTAGGILIMWNCNLASFTVIDHSHQFVFGTLITPNKGLWNVAMVYGHKELQIMRELWSRLDNLVKDDVPTIVGGGFNYLLSKDDKRGGKRFHLTKGSKEMRLFMANQDLHDFGLVPSVLVRHLARIASDNCPIAFKLDDSRHSQSKVFKFEDTWKSCSATWRIVANAWNKHDYGDEDEEDLKNDVLKLQLQEEEDGGLSDTNIKLLRSKVRELNVTLLRLSMWWNQRAKANWNEEGDTNSRFYHAYATARKNCKLIRQIKDENDKVADETDKIESILLKFFEDKWKFRNCNKLNWPSVDQNQLLNAADRLKSCIPKLISEEQASYVPSRSMSDHFLLALEIFNKFRISKIKKGLMALKLDMAQAFDSMCWETLKHVLAWFGFPEKFSFLILECVTNVRFSILLNGKGSRWIEAKSGFRQGCPMSTYLFILCSQLLSNVIKLRGHQLGIQTSSRAPRITHLLYADDLLLFGSASSSQLRGMMNLIRDYCGWTGPSTKWRIGTKYGFKIVNEFQYLGTKIALRRLVKNGFQFVIDHALEKLNAWGTRFLSLAGRLILAKTSLLSLPTFISAHSLIPKRILYEFDRICRDFIWHHNFGNKGLHYIACEDLCLPRDSGGLGMYSTVKRVGPLEARLAKRLLQNPSSLLYRCLAARNGSAIWRGKFKQGQSSPRYIISDGVAFLKPIVKWKL
ncbi:uncharacterized protein LOC110095614 [Dendrobium catenatum]|uniref:uncharacterized protein LOC110095614 n=1 Tax=Dendrobium catenatum TaxID=906689 RepID=UPI0009F5654A|nr:uncharacterized protein LOC110095614 [Dendrobium catenatum]